ncbi:carboxymuconolactone decarboxylase [Mycobacterium sp. 852002-53434_SCH5985345]|uniref:carboxymuconolactone decarboxylase family protein n=1 Tax=unclassified Mycobacterium TaxID=2642494 RepID=UPI0007FE5109|nr:MULTISPECIES: carboxymuconolactone decarboxylase family protein [unclassified Mycobacterium]OBF50013.1 carboxymuconolactone decarboxylase [Mycobacterium sp. 852002-53434_SCH5985345]OBF71099.1 carboxymuconolactone decarboxylase [Mycobacterium sp. 852002-51613_SCH5001154]
MSGPAHGLGGRLDLADRAALDDTARELFDDITANALAWARRCGFAAATADGRLIGPFNPSLLNPGLSAAFLKLQAAEQQCTSLDQRTRQVVLLTVGSVWRAPYELYAHSAVARHVGLSESVIAELVAGTEPEALTDDQRAAHRLARALSTDHHVDDALYDEARQRFGAAGVFDITVLTGIYHTVCGILNAFAIPAPDDH